VSEYQIGSEVQHKDQRWRITRTIFQDVTLFEDETEAYLITESYVQLKNPLGEIDHIVMSSEKSPYNGPPSDIKALTPLAWRKT
jgi:hypothetical protein